MSRTAPVRRFAAIFPRSENGFTEDVDNFVEKPRDKAPRATPGKGWNRVTRKQACKNQMKSMSYDELLRYFRSNRGLAGEFPAPPRLWSNVQAAALGKAH